MKRLFYQCKLGVMAAKGLITLTTIVVFAMSALAGQNDCPQHFVGGSAPEYTNDKISRKTRLLCNQTYAVGHSGIARGPLWSAEHLTRDRLETNKGAARTNDFRADDRLPASERSELSDFARSGFDRGHLTPAADAGFAQSETFLLSNIIPQDSSNNRFLHEQIERSVRNETKKSGELYVITGPMFVGSDLQALKGRVLVGSGIFKCLYDPRRNQAGCYVEHNSPGDDYQVASVSEVEKTTGINLFPALPQTVKDYAMKLPVPKPKKNH